MKKIFSMLLAFAMILSMAIPAFAALPEIGTITINGVSDTTTYEIYRLLDLESYDVASGAYSYKVNSAWSGFFATDEAKAYMSVNASGYVAWNAAEDDDTVAAFAKLALAYAKSSSIVPVETTKITPEHPVSDMVITGTTGKFEGLAMGYYLVDSTMGALCGLTTTNPNASINAKNAIPTIDKQVMEDSTNQWGATNTADIGQVVEYRVTINVHAGAENYVLHDVMEDSLTFVQDSTKTKLYPTHTDPKMQEAFRGVWSIEHVVPSSSGSTTTPVPAEYYTIATTGLADDCPFEVRFTQAFCDHLETNDKIIVHYNAMLNRNADIADEKDAGEVNTGNENTAWLAFGEGNISTKDSVHTYTYGIDLVKTDSQNALINGAGFKIYDAPTGGNEIAVVKMDDNITYRRARADETGIEIMVTDGKVRIVGFDNGTYYAEETTTPAGYNKLTARQKFIISDGNLDAVFNGGIFSTGSGVHVVNKTGSMLPETGGMGTVLFITCGSVLVLAAGVLLVTKKRMSMIQD